jgi:hypothetical protein
VTLTLRQDFKQLTLAECANTGPTLTSVRASGAWRTSSAGVLTLVADNIARTAAHVYENGVWVNKGLLHEGAATNTILQSRDPNTTWSKSGTPVITDSGLKGPDGVSTAYTVTDDDASSAESIVQAGQVACVDSEVWCFSQRFRKSTTDAHWAAVRIRFSGGTPITSEIYIDTDTGDIGTATGGGGNAPTASGIIDEGDWWRVWLTYTNNATSNTVVTGYFWPAWGTTAAISSTPTGGKTVTDFQLEQASRPSSTIVTTTGTVTRETDFIQPSDLTWFNESAGTFVLEGVIQEYTPTTTTRMLAMKNAGDTQTIDIYWNSGVAVRAHYYTGASNFLDAGNFTPGTAFTIATSYAVDDLGASLDGAAVVADTDTGGVLPALMTVATFFNHHGGTRPMQGHIKSIRYYNTKRSDAFLQDPFERVLPPGVQRHSPQWQRRLG